jgi:tripartite-type tricarboxylate transporter receptor subunit TctC
MKFLKALLLGVAVAAPALAQEWPKQRPVQIVIGFGPGATTDTVARIAAQKLQEALGQTFVAENRPGAGGNIATQQVKRAAPDGYTILVTSVAYAVNPSLYANAGYDALTDFAPVVLGPSTPNIITVNPAVPQVKAGKLRAIAVTSARRSPALPEVPTVNEQGYSGFDDLTWVGFFAPAGTPAEIVNRLNAELNRVFASPEVRDRLSALGLESRPNSPAEFAAFLREEVPKWAKAVKDSGAKAD